MTAIKINKWIVSISAATILGTLVGCSGPTGAQPDPPVAVLSGLPDAVSNAGSLDITVSGSDIISYKYRLDGSAWSAERSVSVKIEDPVVVHGWHTVDVIGSNLTGTWQETSEATYHEWYTVYSYSATTAGTSVIGPLGADQTWTSAGSPYKISGDFTVPAGITLTIEAGTIIAVAGSDSTAGGSDPSRIEFRVAGGLYASGTRANPVVLTAQNGAGTWNWYGLVVESGAEGVDLTAVEIGHSRYGVRNNATPETLTSADVIIHDLEP